MKNRKYNNLTMLKALEETDKAKAIEAISDTHLDGVELSELIETSLMGRVVNKHTGEPLKLSNDVIIAGLRNKVNQIISNMECEHENEIMRQGDGSVYGVCGDCGEELY